MILKKFSHSKKIMTFILFFINIYSTVRNQVFMLEEDRWGITILKDITFPNYFC